jgi:putative peptide zinc metalloprotease protein
MRRPAALLTVLATLAATATAGLAQSPPAGGGPSQNVNVDNGNAGTVLARAGVQVARSGGQNASPSNLAHANAHDCTKPCQAIAAAFQIVLVPQNAPVQAPQNVAVATNINCTGCGAFAYAYQYVVTVAKATTLDATAHAQIVAVRREADQDVHAGLDYPTLDSRLHLLAQRLRAAVDGGLTRQGVGESDKHSNQDLKEGPKS